MSMGGRRTVLISDLTRNGYDSFNRVTVEIGRSLVGVFSGGDRVRY